MPEFFEHFACDCVRRHKTREYREVHSHRSLCREHWSASFCLRRWCLGFGCWLDLRYAAITTFNFVYVVLTRRILGLVK